MTSIQNTSLYFTQGSSDKIYQAQINEVDDGYTVTFSYGRRGSALKVGQKTADPVDLVKAEKIYNSLLKSKKSKGYTEGEAGTAYTASNLDKEHSGIYLQLLNEVDEVQAIALCNDERYCAQEKYDGHRRGIKSSKNSIEGINKKGLFTGLTQNIIDHAKTFSYKHYVIDGEQINDRHFAFDILELDGQDLSELPYKERYFHLSNLVVDDKAISVVETAFTTEEKLSLLEKIKAQNGEGLVFKRVDAPYRAGRPNSGGDQLKFKLYASCSVIVEAHNEGKRSVSISGIDDNGNRVPLGNVTIPPNKTIPQINEICEIKYLYAFLGGSLYQPVYKGLRKTVDAEECTLSQLKYKPDCAA